MRILPAAALVLCALTSMPQTARAWSDDGHRIIAQIADHYLLPATRQKVAALLKTDTDTTTAHDLTSAATWADKVRDKDSVSTSAWHFMELTAGRPNIPQACGGHTALAADTPASKGPANACIIDKIDQFAAELADSAADPGERLLALKYLLNLVGDIHQPLRAVDENNGHGVAVNVTAPQMAPGNLFGFWEMTLVSRLEGSGSPTEVARVLLSRISEADAKAWGSRAPQLWALESYQLGVDRAYGMVSAFDDAGRAALQDREIEIAEQTVALQLSRAGVRLAHVLNEALAPTKGESAIMHIAGNAATGKLFAQGPCAVCHVVAPGQKNAATMAPDFAVIARTKDVTDSALAEFLTGPHPTMPNIRLTKKQTDDLVAYIISLR